MSRPRTLTEEQAKEHRRMSAKSYYQRNKEARAAYAREWYRQHYYEDNPEDHNPEKYYWHVRCGEHFTSAAQAVVHISMNDCANLPNN